MDHLLQERREGSATSHAASPGRVSSVSTTQTQKGTCHTRITPLLLLFISCSAQALQSGHSLGLFLQSLKQLEARVATSAFCSPNFGSARGWHFVVRQLLPHVQQLGQVGGHHATRRAVEPRLPSLEKGGVKNPPLSAAPGDILPGHNGSPHPTVMVCSETWTRFQLQNISDSFSFAKPAVSPPGSLQREAWSEPAPCSALRHAPCTIRSCNRSRHLLSQDVSDDGRRKVVGQRGVTQTCKGTT